MSKRFLLSFALAALVVPQVFGMDSDSKSGSINKQEQHELVAMFKSLQQDPSGLYFGNWFNLTDAQFIQVITRLGLDHKSGNITEVALAVNSKITNATLELIAEYYPNLTHLHLCGCNRVTANGIRKLAEKCSALTDLFLPDGMDDEDLEIIAKKCPNLTSLCFAGHFSLTSNGIKQLPKLFPKLKEFKYDLSEKDGRNEAIDGLHGICTINTNMSASNQAGTF